ncbi:hypothetical protein PSU4_46590 [Pseudonocardia sulfidoxydans NBRC 16205]|uniref:DUF1707 domain-containing protein n=1 Tax=Pseudonocardia sulfidoxydans NBRC 16205 TaxID=1223511 RepID=A0A511DLM6_9PSEU|nr:DUF1707 domain-containing protein [Pseudonocardia sulfidoxydans]GEL25705.1 hypothetical protein PSU4_46590 [Pseudonocardia sulfidoxydans NBRC 16205]
MTTGGTEGGATQEPSQGEPPALRKEPGPPALRIGTAEREAAAKALDAHLEAGRLGVEEYADRSAAAAGATVASELQALFTDLPAPHPQLPGQPTTEPTPTSRLPVVDATSREPEARGGFSGWGPRIVAVTPIIALVLFLALNNVFAQAWIFFLLIPIVGGVVYGGDRGREREERRLDRDDRRELRRGDHWGHD